MPRKIRELIADLERAGFVNRGGKVSHRHLLHSKGLRVTISCHPGDNARQYQERDVRQALSTLKDR